MGFHYDARAVRCPLFRNIVMTSKGKFIGIECEQECNKLGFDITHVSRFRTTPEMRDYIGIFCKDMYTTCPYYEEYLREAGD